MKCSSLGVFRNSFLASVLLVSACALPTQERVLFDGDAGSVVFEGRMNGDMPREGKLVFSASRSEFSGRFDDAGFPKEGVLTQVYSDRSGEPLTLSLDGRFRYNASERQLRFRGAFVLSDSKQRVLAESHKSQWVSQYPAAVFRISPPLFAMEGKQQYRQYRRDISPANAPRRLLSIYRPVSGPFIVKANYQDGLPRGVAQIRRELSSGQRYVIERQYFNYQLPDQRSHYFYFEPGSFERVSIIGGCEAPNLTVPQQLINVYAYDCDSGNFYALSESLPASVLSIASSQIDNSGRFHKVRIMHHGNTSEFEVDAEALLQGVLRPHGLYLDWHYGQLRAAHHAQHGQAVGVGIEQLSAGEPRFISHRLEGSEGSAPSESQHAALNGLTANDAERLEQIFKAKGVGSLNTRRAEALKSALVKAYQQPAADAVKQLPGALSLYQRWQQDSNALLSRWPWASRRSAKDISTLRRALLAKHKHYSEQLEALHAEQALRFCRSQGESFDALRWQCRLQADVTIAQICQQAYGITRCDAMQAEFGANSQ